MIRASDWTTMFFSYGIQTNLQGEVAKVLNVLLLSLFMSHSSQGIH